MRNAKAFLVTLSLAAAAVVQARDASACGGCFGPESETTLVTGHKMVLSVSEAQTTLWDEVAYSGDPSSFAWVLPIKGVATVGLSSDALFQALDQLTAVSVAPPFTCPPPSDDCFFGGGATGSGGGTAVGVTIMAQSTVGPYETVQLSSTDPGALKDWLATNGYNVPADVAPVVDAYVSEGFDFLAIKLVPGKDVSAMRPVRVTTSGSSPTLPLRMVAAGAGPVTPVTLWVMGEGRYQTTNVPTFSVDSSQLVWDWDTQSSNYASLREAGFAASNNLGWLTEDAEPFFQWMLSNQLELVTEQDPAASGYGDDMGQGAEDAMNQDLQQLFGNIDGDSLWVTRLSAELSKDALAADLLLEVSPDQSSVTRSFTTINATGTAPTCSSFGCVDDGTTSSVGAGGASFTLNTGSGGGTAGGGTCAMTAGEGAPLFGGFALLAGLGLAGRLSRRRRR